MTRAGKFVWILLLGAVSFALYAPGFNILRYEDDFAAYYDPIPEDVFHFFRHPAQYAFYRPLPGTLFALTQRNFGEATWPIHATNVVGHLLTGVLVFVCMLRIGYTVGASRLASLYLVISQIAAFNVLGNDTTGQVWVVLLGCLSLWFAHERSYLWSMVALAFAFLCKETSVVFVPMLVLVSVVFRVKRRGSDLAVLIPYAALAIIYLWVRSESGSMNILGGEGHYTWGLGFHNLANLAHFAIGLTMPISTVEVFSAWRHDPGRFALFICFALAFSVIVVGALCLSSGARRRTGAFVLLTLAACAPFTLMNHVGESYVNTAMPFFAVLVGIAGNRWLFEGGRSRLARIIGLVILGAVLTSHACAIRGKATLMRQNGASAHQLLRDLRPLIQKVPPGGDLILKHVASEDEIVYSAYLRPGFLLLGNNAMIGVLLGRPDVNITVTSDQPDLYQRAGGMAPLVLTERDVIPVD